MLEGKVQVTLRVKLLSVVMQASAQVHLTEVW